MELNFITNSVLFDVREHVAYITLNNPAQMNPVTAEGMQDLVQCLDYNGDLQWEKTLDAPPLAILDASQPLVFTGTEVSVLTQ